MSTPELHPVSPMLTTPTCPERRAGSLAGGACRQVRDHHLDRKAIVYIANRVLNR